jgi:hypothetical protein
MKMLRFVKLKILVLIVIFFLVIFIFPEELTDLIEKLFIHRIFKTLLKKGLITERVVELITSWRHSGFSTYSGKRINPIDKRSTENLARYIIRASFS